MQYCTECVYPAVSFAPLLFDEDGVCSGCRVRKQAEHVDWDERKRLLGEVLNEYKTDGSNYDCIIPVSGGKDSYFQTHVITSVFGLKPLLVTYHGNNFLECGQRNLERMRDVFDVDHHIFSPSVQLLKKINRLGFKKMGDMNWHNHCGIFTYPVQAAVKFKVPLIIWGEHGYTDLGGMHSIKDSVEMTARYRLEHTCRGFDWHDMIDEEEGITEKDLLWAKYPTDDELGDLGIRGVYISNYMDWDGYKNYVLSRDLYDWQEHPEPFERTYRSFSNMDDMHENGIHDYLKYVKVGYGRATDHACKDIRWGRMTREEGIEMVRKYDHVKPRKDLERWLTYVDMSEEEFDTICDTFRDRRVWRKQNGSWVKDNIWDESIQCSTSTKVPKEPASIPTT